MGIVVITIPGEAQRAFANNLHRKTGGKVDLVIIQKPKSSHLSLFKKLQSLYKAVGPVALPIEIWCAIFLRVNKSLKSALTYFREYDQSVSSELGYLAKIMEVASINDNRTFETLLKLSPDLLVIWGGTIIKPHIISTAKKAINLHMGLCPYFLGAIANQHAVISGQPRKIGATIHYAEEKVDTGDILETIMADTSKPPRQLFMDLNKRAVEKYIEVVMRLSNGENLRSIPQDTSKSANFKLKDWTPRTRYKLAKQILKWEKTGIL